MKKKKILFVILAVVLAFSIIITVISISQYRTKTITNFYNNDVNKIDKINITNGTNGNIVTVTDKKMISSICNYLSKLKFNKIRSQPSTGWSYNISVIENKKDVVNIEFISDIVRREFAHLQLLLIYVFIGTEEILRNTENYMIIINGKILTKVFIP